MELQFCLFVFDLGSSTGLGICTLGVRTDGYSSTVVLRGTYRTYRTPYLPYLPYVPYYYVAAAAAATTCGAWAVDLVVLGHLDSFLDLVDFGVVTISLVFTVYMELQFLFS